jgi:hypothetical protein
MFSAFTAYLRSLPLTCPQLPDVLRVEESLGVCRRELERPCARITAAPTPKAAWVARAPGVATLTVDGETLGWMSTAQQTLFELSLIPAMALVKDAPRVPPLSAPGEGGAKAPRGAPRGGGLGALGAGPRRPHVLGAARRPGLRHRRPPDGLPAPPQRGQSRGLDLDLQEEGLIIAEGP